MEKFIRKAERLNLQSGTTEIDQVLFVIQGLSCVFKYINKAWATGCTSQWLVLRKNIWISPMVIESQTLSLRVVAS